MMSAKHVTRVERTFAFIDISRFTAYTDQRGDAAAVNALADFRTVVRRVASRMGVRIDKWLGDGAMIISVDSGPLVRAVLAIEQELQAMDFPLPLRSGIASGLVILFEGDDYTGGAINLASRLCDLAQPFEVLATTNVGELVPDGIAAIDAGSYAVSGLARAVDVVRLVHASRFEVTGETPLPRT